MGGIGNLHGYFGVTVIIFAVIQLATGDITLLLDKCRGNKPWHANSDKKLVATLHKWGGYFLLFIAHLAIFTGTFRYSQMEDGKGETIKPILILGSFIVLVLICEIIWRLCYTNSKETLTDKST